MLRMSGKLLSLKSKNSRYSLPGVFIREKKISKPYFFYLFNGWHFIKYSSI